MTSGFGNAVEPEFPEEAPEQPKHPNVYDVVFVYRGTQRSRECLGEEQRDAAIADLHAAGIIDYEVVNL